MKLKSLIAGLLAGATLGVIAAQAADLAIVSGDTGNGLAFLRSQLDRFEAETGNKVTIVPMPSSTTDQFGQYKLWLAAGNADIDVYQTDVIWAPQLADQFVDLSAAAKDVVADHFPSIIESQTVNGKLVALPAFTDAPALYYRKDLLEKYGKSVPKTWAELAATAKEIQDAERAAGKADMQGFVFQGNAYEGLTCDALEWVKSYGGGQIIESDGSISINNPQAVAALEMAKSWIGTIAPQGVLNYAEEEARGVFQNGNAAFMRNWPYAWSLGNGADSKIKGKIGVMPLPKGGEDGKNAATLGGWQLAVSKYSKNPDAAASLVMYMTSPEVQKERAIKGSYNPTIAALYKDKAVLDANPFFGSLYDVFTSAVPRPATATGAKYPEVSAAFWNATHDVLSGKASAEDSLKKLEGKLKQVKRNQW